jgi:hypothetical protein
MLTYYVKWLMKQAWRALMFADEDQQVKQLRDPAALARHSIETEDKARTLKRTVCPSVSLSPVCACYARAGVLCLSDV